MDKRLGVALLLGVVMMVGPTASAHWAIGTRLACISDSGLIVDHVHIGTCGRAAPSTTADGAEVHELVADGGMHYVVIDDDVNAYHETNGLDGLQLEEVVALDGSTISADEPTSQEHVIWDHSLIP